METVKIRKIVVSVEETRREMDQEIVPPTRKATAAAVIYNPFSDRYVDNLEPLMVFGAELGRLLGEKALAALGVKPDKVQSYGKAAIVGEAGDTRLQSFTLVWANRCGKSSKKGLPLFPQLRNEVGPGPQLMSLSITRTMSGASHILMRFRLWYRTPLQPTKSLLLLPLPTALDLYPGLPLLISDSI